MSSQNIDQQEERVYQIQRSEKCYRFKPEAIENHAPPTRGIYELVTFDDNQVPRVLFVGAAFDKSIQDHLTAHLEGTGAPTMETLLENHPNLYFDFLTQIGGKTVEDAQDVYWSLVQEFNPPYNKVDEVKPSVRGGDIKVIEID